MKLIELIESGVNYDDILYHDEWVLGMRKCKDLGDAFVYCYPKSGEFVEEHIDRTGYKRVVLCDKILADDKWHKRTLAKPKYRIGDRFILELSHNIKVTAEHMTFNSIYNVIGAVSDIKSYEGRYIYTLSHKDYLEDYRDICDENGVITKEISEEELTTYDMVISQNN